MEKLPVLFVFLVLSGSGIGAQSIYTENTLKLDDPANMPEASISELAWLSGNWVGEAFGGLAEDIWSDPAGGAIMGMFRSVRAGEVGFYEFITISEVDHSLTIKLKHFNPDLTGWEEKGEYVEFPLVKVEKDKMWFDGWTFVKKGKTEYTIYLAIERADGTLREIEFNYTRRKSK